MNLQGKTQGNLRKLLLTMRKNKHTLMIIDLSLEYFAWFSFHCLSVIGGLSDDLGKYHGWMSLCLLSKEQQLQYVNRVLLPFGCLGICIID